jgi:hypothetical protein
VDFFFGDNATLQNMLTQEVVVHRFDDNVGYFWIAELYESVVLGLSSLFVSRYTHAVDFSELGEVSFDLFLVETVRNTTQV